MCALRLSDARLLSPRDQYTNVVVTDYAQQFHLVPTHGLSGLRDRTDETVAPAAVTASAAARSFRLVVPATTSAAGTAAVLRTRPRGVSCSGYTSTAALHLRVPTSPATSGALEPFDYRWGAFDAIDGFFFGLDPDGLYVGYTRRRTDADPDGSDPAVVTRVRQSAWSGDPADGSGLSKYTLDVARGETFVVRFSPGARTVVDFGLLAPWHRPGRTDFLSLHQEILSTPAAPVLDSLALSTTVTRLGTPSTATADAVALVGTRTFGSFGLDVAAALPTRTSPIAAPSVTVSGSGARELLAAFRLRRDVDYLPPRIALTRARFHSTLGHDHVVRVYGCLGGTPSPALAASEFVRTSDETAVELAAVPGRRVELTNPGPLVFGATLVHGLPVDDGGLGTNSFRLFGNDVLYIYAVSVRSTTLTGSYVFAEAW